MGKLGKSYKKIGSFVKKNAKTIGKIGLVAGLATASLYTGGAATPLLMTAIKDGKTAGALGKGVKFLQAGKAKMDAMNNIVQKSRNIGKQTFQSITSKSPSKKPFQDYSASRLNEVEEAKTNLIEIGEKHEAHADVVRNQSFWDWFMGREA